MFDVSSERVQASYADSGDYPYRKACPKPLFGLESFVRHRRIIALSAALFLALGLLYAAVRPNTYTASTQLLIYIRELQPGRETVILPGRAELSVVQNQIEIIQSRSVLLKVIDTLNLKDDPEFAPRDGGNGGFLQPIRNLLQPIRNLFASRPTGLDESRLLTSRTLDFLRRKVSVRRVGTSHTLAISVTAHDPTKAARIANEIAKVYLQERVSAWGSGLSRMPSSLRERLQGLGPNAYVISVAEPPITRDGPRAVVIALAAALLGLGAGGGLALFLDFKNHKIRTPEQVEYLFGLECFGVIPNLPRGVLQHQGPKQQDYWFPNSSGDLLAWVIKRPNSALALSLRRVRAALRDTSVQTVGVTSFIPGEGATTISANLAHLMATSGKRVLLVDTTPGSRSLSHLMASGVQQGLITRQDRGGPLASRIVTDKRTGLDIFLPDSSTAINPDCVWQTLTDDFIREVSESYDLVVVDLPALTSGPEAREAARMLDTFLLVVKWDSTDSELAQRALKSSGTAREKFFGVVINMAEEQESRKFSGNFSLAQRTVGTGIGQAKESGSSATIGLREGESGASS